MCIRDSARIVTKDDGRVVVERPTFNKLLQENQEKVSQNDRNFFNSRRMA